MASVALSTPQLNSAHQPSAIGLPSAEIPSIAQNSLPAPTSTRRRRSSKQCDSVPERLKRGRKSKSDAMLAISTHSPASPRRPKSTDRTQSKKIIEPHPSRHPSRMQQTALTNAGPKLDLDSIRFSAPRNIPRSRQKNRLFDLEHCPVFYPTADEFKDPMKYFESIGPKLKNFGIGKVVPPVGWKPPFVLNTSEFKFKTRLQRLNSMEASARANLNFLEQLYLFHTQQGTAGFVTSSAKIQVPIIDHRPVDLWRLRKQIKEMGGYDTITQQRKWSFLGKTMGYNTKVSPAIAFKLKAAYIKIIAPFDEYLERVKHSPPKPPRKVDQSDRSPADSLSPLTSSITDLDEGDRAHVIRDLAHDSAKLPARTHNQRMSNASMVTVETSAPEHVSPTFQPSKPSKPNQLASDDDQDRGGDICEICGSDEDDPNILLCDYCDKGFHLQCLTPPLESVPEGNWFCDACIVSTGNEFGFEEGKEHTLSSFQRRADSFKKMWIETHPIPDKPARRQSLVKNEDPCLTAEAGVQNEDDEPDSVWSTPAFKDELKVEDHMEREFWRLVESQSETVEIEYGADIPSGAYGSGFPNLEKHPQEPYSRDGWNLNNLPIAPGSLLRFIKSDIAGMTQPWIYVGMVFSTFAWHKEDHYTYSINYHHWGDTKTWYGVPGEDDEKLEAAMKTAAPELFEQQPDLMYQLVTLMSPGRLKRAGVRTYVCDQRPNEFVITCPRSYHSGFNHGFNMNEAVNFCLPDWLKEGSLCVKHYKSLRKMPVFSHDELLLTIFNNEKSPRVSRWLLPHFREMVEREVADRQKALAQITGLSADIVYEPKDLPEEQVQCHHCKAFAFLSQVISPNSTKVACLDHSHILGDGPKILRYKLSDEELQAMLQRVNTRSVKAGRILERSGIEQRTSTRKRKPSAALLEAARAALPLAQKIKLTHASRDGQSDTSVRFDGDTSAIQDDSFEGDEDERMEHESVASDVGRRSISRMGELPDEDEDQEMKPGSSSFINGSRPMQLGLSISGPISALNAVRSKHEPQTVKLTRNVSPSTANKSPSPPVKQNKPPSRLHPRPSISATPSPSPASPKSLVIAAPLPGKRRGRPPKSAEIRAAELQARKLARNQAPTPASTQSTPPRRLTVVAQIDVGGAASIVQLTPDGERVTCPSEPSKFALKPDQNSADIRKRKFKKSDGAETASPKVEGLLPVSVVRPPATSDRPGPNVIRIKSTARAIPQATGEPFPIFNPVPSDIQSAIKPPQEGSPKHSKQATPQLADFDQCRDPNSQSRNTHRPSPTHLNLQCSSRGSTPSSLLNILNPVASEHTPFERIVPLKSTRLIEPIPSAHPMYHTHSSSQSDRYSHPHPSSSQSQFLSYHARTRSPTHQTYNSGPSIQPSNNSAHPSQHPAQSSHAQTIPSKTSHIHHNHSSSTSSTSSQLPSLHASYQSRPRNSPQVTHSAQPVPTTNYQSPASNGNESIHRSDVHRSFSEHPSSGPRSTEAGWWKKDSDGSSKPAGWWG